MQAKKIRKFPSVYKRCKRSPFLPKLTGYASALSCLACVVGLTIWMGLVGKVSENGMQLFIPFSIAYGWMACILGWVSLRQVGALLHKRKFFLFCCHFGLFIILVCASLGSVARQSLTMVIGVGEQKREGVDSSGHLRELPFAIELKRLEAGELPSDRIVSEVNVYPCEDGMPNKRVEVNQPADVMGWKIYQIGFDKNKGDATGVSIFELVFDPWLPFVYIGMGVMALGGLVLLFFSFTGWRENIRWKSVCIAAVGGLLVAVFACSDIVIPKLSGDALPPVLRSPWFIPHVFFYVLAYILLGASALTGLYLLCSKKCENDVGTMRLCDKLVYMGVAWMTLGMLTGAVWAKEAWGHYWTWDPKETWAAVAWFSYLGYIHLRRGYVSKKRLALSVLLISFILLQMCWWGVNYLPSAQGASLHVYR